MTTSTCSTCGRPADDGYVNRAAGERCVDPCHHSRDERYTPARIAGYSRAEIEEHLQERRDRVPCRGCSTPITAGADGDYCPSCTAANEGRLSDEWSRLPTPADSLALAAATRKNVAGARATVAGDPTITPAEAGALIEAAQEADDAAALADEKDDRDYEIASADVTLALDLDDAADLIDALELLRGLDEGEHTDDDRLAALVDTIRRQASAAGADLSAAGKGIVVGLLGD